MEKGVGKSQWCDFGPAGRRWPVFLLFWFLGAAAYYFYVRIEELNGYYGTFILAVEILGEGDLMKSFRSDWQAPTLVTGGLLGGKTHEESHTNCPRTESHTELSQDWQTSVVWASVDD